ncbi:hypothetical protein C8J57DRAFT_144703 [Mycena rebaudengoi]|nr:hypothetical protein C8J57DRAFT_144703 [Mycena rebaudengoi]
MGWGGRILDSESESRCDFVVMSVARNVFYVHAFPVSFGWRQGAKGLASVLVGALAIRSQGGSFVHRACRMLLYACALPSRFGGAGWAGRGRTSVSSALAIRSRRRKFFVCRSCLWNVVCACAPSSPGCGGEGGGLASVFDASAIASRWRKFLYVVLVECFCMHARHVSFSWRGGRAAQGQASVVEWCASYIQARRRQGGLKVYGAYIQK